MKKIAKNKTQKGQGLVEYGLLILLVGIATIFAISLLNQGIRETFKAYIGRNSGTPRDIAPIGGEFEERLPDPNLGNKPPVAAININPDPPIVISGGTITFTSASFDPDIGDSIVSHTWDIFGDGSLLKTGTQVTHVYTTDQPNALWQPRLIVEDTNGATAYTTVYVGAYNSTPPNLPPEVVIQVNPLVGPAPLSVTFQSNSFDRDGTIAKHQWNFGDSSLIQDGATEVHVYQTPGDYEASLIVTDDDGRQAQSARILITVEEPEAPNIPPNASIRANVAAGLAGASIDFITDGASDPDGSVQSYEWDFGDGSPTVGPNVISGGIPIVPHTYTTPGTYTAQLTIWDNDGDSTIKTLPITINARACDNASIRRQIWNGITGTAVSDLTNLATYPHFPDSVETLTALRLAPAAGGDNYADRYLGYVLPPVSGDYTFYISTDDAGDLFLSTDESPANISRIAFVNGSVPDQSWQTEVSQQSAPVSLVGGRKYYFEARHKEGGGGDHLSVGWVQPGQSFPPEVIADGYLCFDDSLIPPPPVATPVLPPTPIVTRAECTYEAEDALLSNVNRATNVSGYSGTGFADYPGGTGANIFVEWNVNVATAGNYQIAFFYGLANGSRPLQLMVNGNIVNPAFPFNATGAWTTWEKSSQTVPLVAGPNTIRLTATSNAGPNVDCLAVADG